MSRWQIYLGPDRAFRTEQPHVSSVTAWEIATKHRLGKLGGVDALVTDMAAWIRLVW